MYRRRYNRCCARFGCFIPLTAEIGDNVTFPHGAYGIFISQGAKIGDNCVIFHHVTIGSNTLVDSKGFGSPTIGNNVYIGAGAKIIRNVRVGNNVRIGVNAVVVRDVPDNATVVVPPPIIISHTKPRNNKFTAYQTYKRSHSIQSHFNLESPLTNKQSLIEKCRQNLTGNGRKTNIFDIYA